MESKNARKAPNQPPHVYLKNCLTRKILNRIANKWTTLIIGVLSNVESARFTELSKSIGGISQKMLTQTLRELERDGLVERKVFPVVPARVEYSLTPLGMTLCEPLQALARWSERHMPAISTAQARYDHREAAKVTNIAELHPSRNTSTLDREPRDGSKVRRYKWVG
jgi:DNA-binding HxlR family transcriptional regulator